MDGCRDGRTARDASETSGDARANDAKKEDTARTGGGDRRPATGTATGVARWRAVSSDARPTNRPCACHGSCVCVMCVES